MAASQLREVIATLERAIIELTTFKIVTTACNAF